MSDIDDEVAAVRAAVPLARRPDRHRRVEGLGVNLAVSEWGDESAPPLLIAHGGFDFVGTLDVFAPMLADGGWRVVAWDQRGHGDSDHTELYSWDADVRDATAVFDSVGTEPVAVVGHSKGGNMMLTFADAQPHRVWRFVNLDGIPAGREAPDVSERDRTRLLAGELDGWLDHRRRLHGHSRRAGTIDEVARRRADMNPRLPIEWLRYLVTVGGHRDPDGWRWNTDAALRMGGFGPRRPEWGLFSVANIGFPFLAVLGTEAEQMGWGTRPSDLAPYLPAEGEVVEVEDVGHFVHIEKPRLVADLTLEFLAR
jgi:pimeloyl-ACP methyl ester carboxylesterase